MATASGPTIWFWMEGGGAPPPTKVHRLPILGVGVLATLLPVLVGLL